MIDELRHLVHRIRRRWFRAVALQIAARAMFGVALIVACGALAERALAPAEPFVLLLGDTVATAVDVAGRPGADNPFRTLVVTAGVQRLNEIDPARVVDRAWIRRGLV